MLMPIGRSKGDDSEPHHTMACIKFNRACDDRRDAECICGADYVYMALCEGCGLKFQEKELEVVTAIDPDLHWC